MLPTQHSDEMKSRVLNLSSTYTLLLNRLNCFVWIECMTIYGKLVGAEFSESSQQQEGSGEESHGENESRN